MQQLPPRGSYNLASWRTLPDPEGFASTGGCMLSVPERCELRRRNNQTAALMANKPVVKTPAGLDAVAFSLACA